MKRLTIAALGAFAALAAPAMAQPTPDQLVISRIERPAVGDPIQLDTVAKSCKETEIWYEMWDQTMVRNTACPTVTAYLPQPWKATGAAVLVVPGGGFQFVSMSNEGWPVAQWLADNGVAAFVLKYRTETTPADDEAFKQALVARFQAPRAGEGPSPEMQVVIGKARADAQSALRLIRANSAKWGVDPQRVGMLGFSAGAMTTMATTLADEDGARPDFIAPIYGFMTPVTPPVRPQPMFAAIASDDPLFRGQGFGLIESWQKAGGSTEVHFYQGGGHGFGSRKMGTTSDLWFDQFMAWMAAQGLLKPPAE